MMRNLNDPRTEAGQDALHAVDMIGEAANLDIGYKDWRERILAIEKQARTQAEAECVARGHLTAADIERFRQEGRQQAVRELVEAANALIERFDVHRNWTPSGATYLSVLGPDVNHLREVVAGLNASESGQPPEASDE